MPAETASAVVTEPMGVRRMRPDDHFMILTETDATPMQVGSLTLLDVPDAERAGFYGKIRRHLAERLPATPLLAVLHQAPDGFDSDVWVDVAEADLDYHVERISEPLDAAGLRADMARRSMVRLDLSRPPFRIAVFDNLAEGGCALHIKMHHSVADGIGFQTVLGLLTDDAPPANARRTPGVLPSDADWRAAAEARFAAEEPQREVKRAAISAAQAVLKSGELPPRAHTPVLKLSGPTSTKRAYATLSLPLARFKALSKAYGGTINDIFLAVAASALRRYLIEIDDLPEDPVVVNSARSYRRPEHGEFGNRIVALHPHLATDIADPLARLRAIQRSMADERVRTPHDEAMLDALEKPFGARDRRAKFAERTSTGAAILAGNVTLSNVPGPDTPRYMAGYRQVANYPTPILGSGRFLNITSRRNADSLDMGVMTDAEKVPDVDRIARYVADAVAEYEALAPK